MSIKKYNIDTDRVSILNQRIVLFATSGGSGFGNTVKELKPSVANSTVIKEGKLLNGHYSKDELKKWVESL